MKEITKRESGHVTTLWINNVFKELGSKLHPDWKKKLFPAGLEPATFRVLSGRDNHYTTETGYEWTVLTLVVC